MDIADKNFRNGNRYHPIIAEVNGIRIYHDLQTKLVCAENMRDPQTSVQLSTHTNELVVLTRGQFTPWQHQGFSAVRVRGTRC